MTWEILKKPHPFQVLFDFDPAFALRDHLKERIQSPGKQISKIRSWLKREHNEIREAYQKTRADRSKVRAHS